MIELNVRRKSSGVPILSRKDFDEIARVVLTDYDSRYLKEPQPFNVDLFAQEYLGMDQDFQYLSHNGVYMGMTIFNDTDKLPVYDPRTRRAKWVSEKANTIVIDNRLLENDKESQYRFTMGHECIHGMLHKAFFSYIPGQLSFFDQLGPQYCEPLIRCRHQVRGGRSNRNYREWTDIDWMEWQANAGASSLLMPKDAVLNVTTDLHLRGYRGMSFAEIAANEMTRVFKVSYSAAAFRIKSLGILDGIIDVTERGKFKYHDNDRRPLGNGWDINNGFNY